MPFQSAPRARTSPTNPIPRPAANLSRPAFTLPEMLVVVGVIALLIAVLLPALSSSKKTAEMAKSMSNLSQITKWMTLYSSDNREYIVPSQFDYTVSASPPLNYPVKVRSDASLGALQFKGTWTDILWTYNDVGRSQAVVNEGALDRYRYDSPDKTVYDNNSTYDENPFRSSTANTRDYPGGDGNALPFGNGATEAGVPGYFAANNFFNTATGLPSGLPARWYATGQIRVPGRSVYVLDSLAGETIDPLDPPYDNSVSPPTTLQVDFRYNGVCLMLFLDGHVSPETPWTNLAELQDNRNIKITDLDKN